MAYSKNKTFKKLVRFFKKEAKGAKKEVVESVKSLGPGLVTGAADDDPSGVVTYTVAGAQFGYRLGWMVPFSLPLMIAVQEMCARIGVVTGKGLAGVIRQYYSKWLLYFAVILLFIANSINIGADLGALAAVTQLLFRQYAHIIINFVVLTILFTALTLVLEVFVSYRVYAKYLKWLTLSLLAYAVTAFIVQHNGFQLLRYTFIPYLTWDKALFMAIVGFLGTTISPYLFFWQPAEEVEEEIEAGRIRGFGKGKPRIGKRYLQIMRKDNLFGMIYSNVAAYFIVITAAATLYRAGVTDINNAAEAAEALAPLAGNFASIVFAIGIIGVGLLGIPTLAGSAAYAVAETFGWKEGLYRKFSQAKGFYGVIIFATIIGLGINFINVPPMKALYYAAIINGIVAPPLIFIFLLLGNNKKIMGEYTNGIWSNIFGGLAFLVMTAAAGALFLLR